MAAEICGKPMYEPDKRTSIGALALYISNGSVGDFQPMSANFGIIEGLDERIRNKSERYRKIAERSLEIVRESLEKED